MTVYHERNIHFMQDKRGSIACRFYREAKLETVEAIIAGRTERSNSADTIKENRPGTGLLLLFCFIF